MPEKNLDYYYVKIPRKDHPVTFITDVDSIIPLIASCDRTSDFPVGDY